MRVRSLVLTAALLLLQTLPSLAGGEMQSFEHFVANDGMRLRVWEKLVGLERGKDIIILAHGSGTAGQESFDLQVPGRPSGGEAPFSLMDALAQAGFDVFAPDVRGFGRSTHPERGVTTEDARDDLAVVIDYVRKERGVSRVNVVAWSWGTQYAGLAVAAHPEKIARYVSYAQMHEQSPDVVKRRERLDEFRRAPYIEIPEGGWRKRFTSMTPPEVSEPAMVDRFASAAFSAEKKTATGPQVDMTTRLPLLDPAKITVPTLMIHGQYDDVADTAGLLPFFAALPSPVKSYVIVPDAGHMAHLQRGRGVLQRAIITFLQP